MHCSCIAYLGPHAKVNNVSSGDTDGISTVDIFYNDFSNVIATNIVLEWKNSRAVYLGNNIWRLRGVPDGTVISVKASTRGASATLRLFVPPVVCKGTVTGLAVVPGGTCLSFTWDAASEFPFGYAFTLYSYGVVIVEGVTATNSCVILDLFPGTPYKFELYGLCEPTLRGSPTSIETATQSEAHLGPLFDIESVDESSPTTCDITIGYSDYTCATDFETPVVSNPPSGWAGTVVVISATQWKITDMPYDYDIALQLTAHSDSSCPCVAYPDVTLYRTLYIMTPSPPVTPCTSIPINNLHLQTANATCLTFAWDVQSLFHAGYAYQLTKNDTVIQSGTIPNFSTNTIALEDLEESTDYVFTIAGKCAPTTSGTPYDLPASTIAASIPTLPPFRQTSSNVTFQYVTGSLYDVDISYSGYTCVSTPVLSWSMVSPPQGSNIVPVDTTHWKITNVPQGSILTLKFTAKTSTDCMCVSAENTLSTPVVITVQTSPCTSKVLQPQVSTGSTCVVATWANNFPYGFTWKLTQDGITVQSGKLSALSLQLNVAASTAYVFSLQGWCSPTTSTGWRSVPFTTTATRPPSLGTFTQSSTDVSFVFDPSGTTCSIHLFYPSSEVVCATDLELSWNQTPPSSSTITKMGAYDFVIDNVPVDTTVNFLMNASALAPACGNSCASGTVAAVPVVIIVPSGPPPPSTSALYELVITNYEGPPNSLTVNEVEASTSTDPVLIGGGTGIGSYAFYSAGYKHYSAAVTQGFVAYNSQSKTFQNGTYTLPIKAMYYGVSMDPTVQGACIAAPKHESFAAQLTGFYADSNSTLTPARESFQYPPVIELYLDLIRYNWNVAKGTTGYTSSTLMVQLAGTYYGSKKRNEQWWFSASIDPGTGEITTGSPNDPKSEDSIIDGIANDGNGSPDTFFAAGWNCLERWFMYTAYCNQQIRKCIAAGEVVTADGAHVMGLSDIGVAVPVQFAQISAITTDQEGNGFQNILYPDTASPNDYYYYEPWFASITSADCNSTVKALWDKWMNQTTSLSFTPPSHFNGANMVAPHGRADGTTFVIPCAMSMTTPDLIKDMTISDVGSSDFDSVNYVFHEIYDTSDSSPFRCLGAASKGVTCSKGGDAVSGAPFTDEVYADAYGNRNDPTNQYVKNPETFAGVWDNLVLVTQDGCEKPLNIVGGELVPDASTTTTSGFCAFNDASHQWAPRMETSEFDPWTTPAGTLWLLPSNAFVEANVDAMCAGWCLEGSRYDLYNGKWASAYTPVDYTKVAQGTNGADGGALWDDLTTGLKPRVASMMKDISTPASAAGQVWMLSCQCGPFINNMGVRASARTGTGTFTTADIYGFACPDQSLNAPSAGGWPGWKGMRGQWYGPGTSANANKYQRLITDQMLIPGTDASEMKPTGASENNFGVFYDIRIQEAAWAAMARDLSGKGTNPNGISDTSKLKYTPTTTGPVQLGCYELAYIPFSWYKPGSV